MKVILLTAFILTLVPGSMLLPCVKKNTQQAYDAFVHKHVLTKSFDKTSENAWATYLKGENLCGRAPKQSFIGASQTEIDKICSPDGRRKNTNLCMSRYLMDVYVISSTFRKVCSVQSIWKRSQYVTVACDNVENHCRPVHFEEKIDKLPGRRPCVQP